MGKGSEDNEHKQWEIKVFYTPILHKRYTSGTKHVRRGVSWGAITSYAARANRNYKTTYVFTDDRGFRAACRP